jgi:hypothetical protein
MDEQQHLSPATLPPTHTIPTHLATADSVLSLGYLSLTSRQLLLLLVGGSFAVSIWTRTDFLSAFIPPVGGGLHWLLLILSGLLVLALTFGQIAGRQLDAWVIVVGVYLLRPRLYLWKSIRWTRSLASTINGRSL